MKEKCKNNNNKDRKEQGGGGGDREVSERVRAK